MKSRELIIEISPTIPEPLRGLDELANNLWYSWDRPTRALFGPLDSQLWRRLGHNPKLFLRHVDEARLQAAAEDQVFLASYHRVLSTYNTYQRGGRASIGESELDQGELIAYFCAEYGFHESFPIYSGGLGILAGDHCKTASDLCLPFVAVGLLYRMGYFFQTIDGDGRQIANYLESDPEDLPVEPARDADGNEIYVDIEFPGRTVVLKVWKAEVGHVQLYLLDSYVDQNSEEDKAITHQLYGGDSALRLKQEYILGIGGVRALRSLGLAPTVWHINEGHAAFQVLERCRELVGDGLDFSVALEAVSACTVFTTHTPVPAGHDHFSVDMVSEYFDRFAQEIGVPLETILSLGQNANPQADFNMTNLAIHGSRHQNGVSRLHGEVSSQILHYCWPQIPVEENPIGYVTNGVHVPTFLAQEWSDLFDRFLGAEWRNHLSDVDFWTRIDEIPDHLFWSTSQSIKSQMLYALRDSLIQQHLKNSVSEAHLERILKFCDPGDPNILTIGFARRFATYKRATLLFNDLDWFRQLVSDADRPILFVFAGKAHPADMPGQELMRRIHEISCMPEFVGKVMLVEGYDLGLSRRLVSGVDVWLNTPVHSMEASGTSGMKAAINATLNLSMLDGWWAEAYDGENGWGIVESRHVDDAGRRDYDDAMTLYEILQDSVIPLYYDRGTHGYSERWVKKAKYSMATILPRFNMCRVLNEYVNSLYLPAARQGKLLAGDNHSVARELAAWKQKIRSAWDSISISHEALPPRRIKFNDRVRMEVSVQLNGLTPGDVAVELLVSRFEEEPERIRAGGFTTGETPFSGMSSGPEQVTMAIRFEPEGEPDDSGTQRFVIDWQPEWCGRLSYRVRVFPYHTSLTHALEMGLMVWL